MKTLGTHLRFSIKLFFFFLDFWLPMLMYPNGTPELNYYTFRPSILSSWSKTKQCSDFPWFHLNHILWLWQCCCYLVRHRPTTDSLNGGRYIFWNVCSLCVYNIFSIISLKIHQHFPNVLVTLELNSKSPSSLNLISTPHTETDLISIFQIQK